MHSAGAFSSVMAAIFVLAATTTTHAAPPIEVGQTAPNFTLRDQAGKETSLDKLVKQKPVALVFYRSADW